MSFRTTARSTDGLLKSGGNLAYPDVSETLIQAFRFQNQLKPFYIQCSFDHHPVLEFFSLDLCARSIDALILSSCCSYIFFSKNKELILVMLLALLMVP